MNTRVLGCLLLVTASCVNSGSPTSGGTGGGGGTGSGGRGGDEAGGSAGTVMPPDDFGDGTAAEYVPAMPSCTNNEAQMLSDLKITPASISFGNVSVTDKKQIKFTIENTGSVASELPTIEFVKGARLGFSLESINRNLIACYPRSEPKSLCIYGITFEPSSKGFAGGIVRVRSADGASVDIELCGTGIQATPLELTTSAAIVDLGMYSIAPKERGFRVETRRNKDSVRHTGLISFELTGPISIVSECENGISVSSASSCFVEVSPNSENVGPFEGSIKVTAERAVSPVTVKVVGNALPK